MGPVEMENSDWEMEGNPWLHDTEGPTFFGVFDSLGEVGAEPFHVARCWLLVARR